jgi:hypothetical protein
VVLLQACLAATWARRAPNPAAPIWTSGRWLAKWKLLDASSMVGLIGPSATRSCAPPNADSSCLSLRGLAGRPAEWLERPDLVEQAERLDRLAADFDLVTTLSLAGFEGGDWDYFEQELAKYGIAVMGGWLRTGLIFSRYAARVFGGLPEMSRDFQPDEVEELT